MHTELQWNTLIEHTIGINTTLVTDLEHGITKGLQHVYLASSKLTLKGAQNLMYLHNIQD